jgi:methyl-accepting chemotaxis protein
MHGGVLRSRARGRTLGKGIRMPQATGSHGPTGPHQRKVRNFLLDAHFQLRYAGYLVAIALTVSLLFGIALWVIAERLYETSQDSMALGNQSVQAGADSVRAGERALHENKKVNEVVKMNIVEDPSYKDNPELLEAFQADAKEKDEKLLEEQASLERNAKNLEGNAKALIANAAQMSSQMTLLGWTVGLGIVMFVVMIGLGGIVVTHKIAGPLFKVRRHFREVGNGDLTRPSGLRKGDELVEFFTTFQDTVSKLRARAEEDLRDLNEAMAALGSEADAQQLAGLRRLRDRLRKSLVERDTMPPPR